MSLRQISPGTGFVTRELSVSARQAEARPQVLPRRQLGEHAADPERQADAVHGREEEGGGHRLRGPARRWKRGGGGDGDGRRRKLSSRRRRRWKTSGVFRVDGGAKPPIDDDPHRLRVDARGACPRLLRAYWARGRRRQQGVGRQSSGSVQASEGQPGTGRRRVERQRHSRGRAGRIRGRRHQVQVLHGAGGRSGGHEETKVCGCISRFQSVTASAPSHRFGQFSGSGLPAHILPLVGGGGGAGGGRRRNSNVSPAPRRNFSQTVAASALSDKFPR